MKSSDANAHNDLSNGAPSAPPASMVERVAQRMADMEGWVWTALEAGAHGGFNFRDGWRDHYGDPTRLYFTDLARAAIRAMREPSPNMDMAVFRLFKAKARGKFSSQAAAHQADIALETWQAMIDEALK